MSGGEHALKNTSDYSDRHHHDIRLVESMLCPGGQPGPHWVFATVSRTVPPHDDLQY